MSELNCVVVGDSFIGKTSMIHVFANESFKEQNVTTVADDYSTMLTVDSEEVRINVTDTSGSADFKNIRILSYN